MQRWRTTQAVELAPGDTARLRDGRSLRVIEAAALPGGRHEFLAVAPLEGRGSAAGTNTDDGATAANEVSPASPETGSSPGDILVEAEPLPLPYELPV
jgi:hypothetical protein